LKIYAVADIHAKTRRLNHIVANVNRLSPDLVVIAGDLTNYLSSPFVVERLGKLPVPVFAIRGNTDRKVVSRQIERNAGIFTGYLPQTAHRPFSVAGLDGTLPIPFRSRIRLNETKILNRIAPLVNRETILVVHTPPWGVLDEVMGKYHAGSKNLLKFIQHKQPPVVLCGHIHERPGLKQLGKTCIVNCTMGHGSRGAVIHLNPKNLYASDVEVLHRHP